MLTFISFTFKILLTLILALVVVFFSSRDKIDNNNNKKLIFYSLSIVSILSILHNISLTSSELYYSFGILSSTLILIFFIFNDSNASKNYIILYSITILISSGYILSCLLLITIFILLDNYFINIEEYFNSNSIDIDERVEIVESEEE